MSELSKRMRHRRFRIKQGSDVRLVLESPTGAKFDFKIDNISLTGIGAVLDSALPEGEGLEVNAILPAGKIMFDGNEQTIGRVVLRSRSEKDGTTRISISTVDAKLPVDGPIGRHFEEALDEDRSAYSFELSPDKFSMVNFVDGQTTGTDLFEKAKKFRVYVSDYRKTPRFAYMNVRKASMGERVTLDRARKDGRQDYIMMASNDYLGLASHPEVREAAKKAIDDYGFGSTGSPITTGMSDLHLELSAELARMFGKEECVLWNSGYTANVGIIPALIHAQDMVVADMLSHASIQDAMQMARGASRFFKHNNVEHLDKILSENRDQYNGCLVVTEGVFSMDGDVAPIKDVIKVAKKHKARVMVDEAHSFGVIGKRGLGGAEKFNSLEDVDIVMGTFSKICGGIGGFAAVSADVAEWLYFWSRAHMFSVSIPPSTAAAALKALQIFQRDATLVSRLRANIEHFKAGLSSLGYHLPASHESAVIPVIIGDEKKMETMTKIILDAGVFVIPILYPAVSRNHCRFRFTVMATHSTSDLDYVLNVLETAMAKANFDVSAVTPPGTVKAA